MNKKILFLGIVQVIIFCSVGNIFFNNVPWYNSKPISQMNEYMLERNPVIPQNAKYFSNNHGKATFYQDSRVENPQRYYISIISILLGWLFLVCSGIYSFMIVKGLTLKEALFKYRFNGKYHHPNKSLQRKFFGCAKKFR